MNENDKNLINAYFDGELSAEEASSVEYLISSNDEANDYANNIKRANAEINTYFETDDFKELRSEISAFTDNLKSDKKKISVIDLIVSLLSRRIITGSALAASIIYFAMIPSNINDENVMFFSDDLSEFSEELGYVDYLKYRGQSDIDDSIKKFLIESINYMIENQLINVVMSYGSDSYYIKLENIELNEENRYCLKGYYKHENKNQSFIQCQTQDEATISFF
tara:strand:+ start:201 stop:869 length:669 start_codon:yes stop_codon:yes gene_type:complete